MSKWIDLSGGVVVNTDHIVVVRDLQYEEPKRLGLEIELASGLKIRETAIGLDDFLQKLLDEESVSETIRHEHFNMDL